MLLAKEQLLNFEDIEESSAIKAFAIRIETKVGHSSELSWGTLVSTFIPYLNLKEFNE